MGLRKRYGGNMEKRIGIINHWMVNNYGALLLAYALERKLRELGYNVETISWLPDEVKKPWKLSMIKKTGLIHYLLRLGYFSVFVLPRERSFSHFRSLMSTSKEKYSDTTLPNISQKYDKIIIGGDQLWNCKINYFNINNFLPFIHERNRKVVYAASLAQDEMRKGFREEFRQLAMGFGYITTRERRGKEIIEEITGLSAPRVADPAFLLTADDWAELAIEPKKKKKYIFVYQVQYDAVVTQFAQKIAKENMEKNGVQIMSWGPFAEGKNNYFQNPVLKKIGESHQKTVAQTALRFLIQSGVVVIPKSTHRNRMEENFNVFDFALTEEEMKEIQGLDQGESLFFSHYDPKTVEWFLTLC